MSSFWPGLSSGSREFNTTSPARRRAFVANGPNPVGVFGGERHMALLLSQLAALGLGVWLISSMRDFGVAYRTALAPHAEASPKEGSVFTVTGSSRRTARQLVTAR